MYVVSYQYLHPLRLGSCFEIITSCKNGLVLVSVWSLLTEALVNQAIFLFCLLIDERKQGFSNSLNTASTAHPCANYGSSWCENVSVVHLALRVLTLSQGWISWVRVLHVAVRVHSNLLLCLPLLLVHCIHTSYLNFHFSLCSHALNVFPKSTCRCGVHSM